MTSYVDFFIDRLCVFHMMMNDHKLIQLSFYTIAYNVTAHLVQPVLTHTKLSLQEKKPKRLELLFMMQ